MRKCRVIGLGALCAVALAGRANASVLLYEGFGYGTGDVAAQSGGTGWGANAWTASLANTGYTVSQQVVSPGLAYTGLTATGNRLAVNESATNSTSGKATANRLMSTTIGASSGTVWFSVLIADDAGNNGNLDGSSPSSASLVLTDQYSNVTLNMGYSNANAGPLWNMKSGTTSIPVTGGPVKDGSANFLLAKMDLVNKLGEVWINPDPSTEPLGGTGTSFTVFRASFDRIILTAATSSRTGNSTASFDEIRLGTTFADASPVPEPTTAAVFGLAGCLLALRRRR